MPGSEEILYAYGAAATWGTAVQLGANQGFYAEPATINTTAAKVIDDSVGQAWPTDATPGEITCTVDLPGRLRFNDPVRLLQLAQFMGTAGAPTTPGGGTTSRNHVLKFAESIFGLFGTFCSQMGDMGIQEIPSFKPSRVMLRWETGQPLKITFSGIGIDEVTGSSVNTAITFADVTIPTGGRNNAIYAAQTVIRMNAQGGAALDSDDNLPWSAIELTLERKQRGIYGTYVSGDANPRDLIDEPTNNADETGIFSGTLSVSIPRAEDFSGWDAVRALSATKCEIICTGPIIEGAIPYLFKVALPHLSPRTATTPHARGIIATTREFDIFGATAAPTGMTDNLGPAWIHLTNTITADLLA